MCINPINGLEFEDSNVWPEVLRALFISGNTMVKAIITEGGNSTSGLTIAAFSMTPRHMFCSAKVLPNLTSLHLHIDIEVLEDFDIGADVRSELFSKRVIARILSAAINLKVLKIEMIGTCIDLDPDPLTFQMILGGCKMPKLVTFGLIDFTVTEAEMKAFLLHSREIRHMSLDKVDMVSGSWESVFQAIKDTLPLESFVSKDLSGGATDLFDLDYFRADTIMKGFLFEDGPSPFSNGGYDILP